MTDTLWLCFLTERHQLSVVGWQWHGVHALGRSRWRWRLWDRRVRVHGREWRLAASWLWNSAARSPVPCSPKSLQAKSVLLQWKSVHPTLHLFSFWFLLFTAECVKLPISRLLLLSLAGNKPLTTNVMACPSTWVKFGHGCYSFESVAEKRSFEKSREHCRNKGKLFVGYALQSLQTQLLSVNVSRPIAVNYLASQLFFQIVAWRVAFWVSLTCFTLSDSF